MFRIFGVMCLLINGETTCNTHYRSDFKTWPTHELCMPHAEAALEETGDLKIPQSEGILTKNMLHSELGDIISGKKVGRETEEEVTVFKSVGLAIVDIIVAQYFYKKLIQS